MRALYGSRFFAVLVVLAITFTYFSVTQAHFLTEGNIKDLLTSVTITFLVAIGLTFVLLSGGFDLSLGATLAICGIALGEFTVGSGMPLAVAIVLTLALGAALGAANGILIGRYDLSFLVVTLGSTAALQGLLNLWSDAKTTPVQAPTLDTMAFGALFGIPIPVWIMGATFLVALYVLRRTYFGRDVYAVGGSAAAARLSGISVARTIVAVYAIAGLLAALAGVLQVARIGAASPLVGTTVVFDAGAAVLLGGTSLAGGVGGVGGTVTGVLFLGVLQNGLAVAGVQSYWQQLITGVILILAVALDRAQREGSLRGVLRRRSPSPEPATQEAAEQ